MNLLALTLMTLFCAVFTSVTGTHKTSRFLPSDIVITYPTVNDNKQFVTC